MSQELQVPADPGKLTAFQGRVAENGFKCFFCQLFPVTGSKVQDSRNRVELRFLVGFGETVPGTYVLARITAKHPVVKLSLHLLRYQLILQLYGKVRNTFAAIYYARHYQRFGGTGVQAART